MGNRRRTVYYVCFYAEPEFSKEIVSYPSVWSKIEYISDSLKKCGYDICYVCPVLPHNGKFRKRTVQIDSNEKHIYFSAHTGGKFKFGNKFNSFLQMFKILMYLVKNAKKDDRILIYHSMFHTFWVPILKNLFKKPYFLQIEDVYSALSPEGKSFEDKEWKFFETANGYLCVNSLIKGKIHNPAPKIISHGRYVVSDILENKKNDKCRLVYAGVIEQVRNGAFLATQAMCDLSDRYELVVLGFGEEKDINDLKTLINKINAEKGWDCVKYLGYMAGEEYLRELQKCSIAFSTHKYDETNMKSADYTFPSKLLVYMGNGLRIVAQDLKCLRTSKIDKYITYYKSPTPKSVAEAVMEIDINKDYDCRMKIQQLDKQFCENIDELFK